MKVSVLVACHNGADTIEAAVRSALEQTHTDLEVVVVDDASTDTTLKVLAGIEDPRLVVLQQQPNAGPGPARNRALEACTGDWITFLDADDLYHRQRIERLASMARHLGDDAILGDAIRSWTTTPPQVDPLGPLGIAERHDLASFLATDTHFKGFFSRSLLERTGARQPALRAGEDTAFLARLAAGGATFVRVRGRTYFYRVDRGSLTRAPEQPERVLKMIALLRSELKGAQVHASLDVLEAKHRQTAWYRRLATLIREGEVASAARHAASRPDLLVSTPLRWMRSKSAWRRLRAR